MKAKHAFAGKAVVIISGEYKDQDYQVEDWWENVAGKSWMHCDGNPACLQYAIRSGTKDYLPTDDNVVYGKIGNAGILIHNSELPKEARDDT